MSLFFFFFQAEDGIRDYKVTGVQTCALPICSLVSESSAAGHFFNLLPSLLVMKSLSTAQKIGLYHAAILYVVAGVFHFTKTEAYLKIMPPYIPYHVPLVLISGVFEILGGLGLLLPQMRRAAAWGLIALLIAVFPANIYMATNPIQAGAVSVAPPLRWARLPLQLLLVWWLLWFPRSRAIFP